MPARNGRNRSSNDNDSSMKLEPLPGTPDGPLLPEEEDYLRAPDDAVVEEERALDATAPEAAKPVGGRRRGPILTEAQQRQVALWHVEGFSYKEARTLMERDWGFSITENAWSYYRTFRTDLLEGAVKFLRDSYMKFGVAERAVRVHKLVQHYKYLEQLKAKEGLFTTDTQTISFGNRTQVVTTKQFQAALSREIRETLGQIDKMTSPVERALLQAEGDLPGALGGVAQRMLAASNWGREEAEEGGPN